MTTAFRQSSYFTIGFRALLVAAGLLAGGLVSAQSQNVEDPIEEVVVTGSRIPRSDLSAPSPTVVVDEHFVRDTGNVTLEKSLNQLPQLRPQGTSTANGSNGSGILGADLRGLGRQRTLVLVNGRRTAPADASGVSDLSAVPTGLIDRVEIITGGASAVYGSDAIAGAVNFILKDNFEGAEVDLQYGETEFGDAETTNLKLTAGGNFADDRGNAVIYLSYTEREPVFHADRALTRFALEPNQDGELVPSGSSRVPGTQIGVGSSVYQTLNNIDMSDFSSDLDYAIDQSGACDNAANVASVRFGHGGVPLPWCNPNHTFNPNPFNYILRPMERTLIQALGHYDISDRTTFYVEGNFTKHENAYRSAPATIAPVTPGKNFLEIPNLADNPVIPQVTRDFFLANAHVWDPDGDGTYEVSGAGRRLNEGGARKWSFIKNSYGITAGFRGDIDLGNKNWNWDVFGQKMELTQTEHKQNVQSLARMSMGLDVVVDPISGEASCRVQVLGCVPINIFGLDSLTPAMVDFITPDTGDSNVFGRSVYGASLTGSLIDLPAGPLGIALGVESRTEQYRFLPNAGNEDGPNGSPEMAVDESIDLTEFFVEARIPLLLNRKFVESLSIELAGRISDYSTVGSVNTYKYGLQWAPTPSLNFRTAFNRAIRAPSLIELYEEQTTGGQNGTDPCTFDQNPSQALKDFCVIWGVPAADIDTFAPFSGIPNVTSGGNPNLQEETSDTFTVGFAYSPEAVPGLNLTLDYYQIEIEGAIARGRALDLLNRCADVMVLSNIACQAINRSATSGFILSAQATRENLAVMEVEGLDLQADYQFDVGSRGSTIDLKGLVSWTFKNGRATYAGDPLTECAGYFGGDCQRFADPIKENIGGYLNARYNAESFGVGLSARYIGEYKQQPGLDLFRSNIPAETYFNLDASYNLTDSLLLYGGIQNLTDNKPTLVGGNLSDDTNADPDIYDFQGRRFFIGARMSFGS